MTMTPADVLRNEKMHLQQSGRNYRRGRGAAQIVEDIEQRGYLAAATKHSFTAILDAESFTGGKMMTPTHHECLAALVDLLAVAWADQRACPNGPLTAAQCRKLTARYTKMSQERLELTRRRLGEGDARLP